MQNQYAISQMIMESGAAGTGVSEAARQTPGLNFTVDRNPIQRQTVFVNCMPGNKCFIVSIIFLMFYGIICMGACTFYC